VGQLEKRTVKVQGIQGETYARLTLDDINPAIRKNLFWRSQFEPTTKIAKESLSLEGAKKFEQLIQGDKLWIITESDRTVTTLLLPEGY
jgi:hypothetical protein